MGCKVRLKQFKDPIYDYIEIDSHIVADIIDTPTFQRLKDIRQTSYMPLFPAAYHNRYIHSLGVYHLGRIAFRAIEPQLREYSQDTDLKDKIDRIQEIFELACLLHDVGHAPFSHTGETFFLDESGSLYTLLQKCVNEDEFEKDFSGLATKKPAPHECMSCVVGLKKFHQYFSEASVRSFFARCIIGMPIQFREKEPENFSGKMSPEIKKEVKRKREAYKARKKENELLNCVISLLNSSIIDVDRLDYIIRDSATIGFKNAQVDYKRLLKGMRIVQYQGKLCIGYHKSALSVIESAVYAHDAERKWVQSHPSILYEMEALKNAMSTLTGIFSSESDTNPLFCYESLTEEGKLLSMPVQLFSDEAEELFHKGDLWSPEAKRLLHKNELFTGEINTENLRIVKQYPVSLLADEDFLYLMKTFCKDGLGYEYFSRNRRRLAVWKSEAEFRALFQERIGDDSRSIKKLESNFESLVDYCQSKTGVPIVNADILVLLDKEHQEAVRAKEEEEIDEDYYEDIVRGVREKKRLVEELEKIAELLDLHFEFLIIFQKKFSSSFKEAIGDIPVLFPNLDDSVVPLRSVIDVLTAGNGRKSNFFHLFYRPKDLNSIDKKRKNQIVNTIAKRLIAIMND